MFIYAIISSTTEKYQIYSKFGSWTTSLSGTKLQSEKDQGNDGPYLLYQPIHSPNLYEQNTTLFSTKAFIILDNDGKRILAKYYTPEFPTSKEQLQLEKSLFDKSKKAQSKPI